LLAGLGIVGYAIVRVTKNLTPEVRWHAHVVLTLLRVRAQPRRRMIGARARRTGRAMLHAQRASDVSCG
jgi:hypothetical protein